MTELPADWQLANSETEEVGERGVYSALAVHQIFSAGEVVDEVIDLRLPFNEIFE